jgi:metal-sulfur cluster biosynthetic enzyme
VKVLYTPTIPHCSMAQMIGLMLKVKLLRSVSGRYRIDVKVTPETHVSELDINKQLRDKERVAAAL